MQSKVEIYNFYFKINSKYPFTLLYHTSLQIFKSIESICLLGFKVEWPYSSPWRIFYHKNWFNTLEILGSIEIKSHWFLQKKF